MTSLFLISKTLLQPVSYSGLRTISRTLSATTDPISSEELKNASERIDKLAKSHLKKYRITAETLPKVLDTSGKNYQIIDAQGFTQTANMYTWVVGSPAKPFQIASDGTPKLLNSDKELLIKTLAALFYKNMISFGKKISVINEGCDNGDYLSLLIPFLVNSDTESIRVFLTNGHERKLKLAYRLSESLLPKKGNTFMGYMNAFFDQLPRDVNSDDFQKLFLFFRLVIVEHPDIVKSFVHKRLQDMKVGDIAIASFLIPDDLATEAMKHYGLSPQALSRNGDRLYIKPIPPSIQKKLLEKGYKGDVSQRTNAAFTESAVQAIIEKGKGKILCAKTIETKTDEDKLIRVSGTIFQKM